MRHNFISVASGILLASSTTVNAQGCDWQPLGTGVMPAADACAVLANGDVVYGGRFSLAGSTPVGFVARWDGSQWHEMGTGFNSFVRTLLALPDGSVIAGGQFTMTIGPRQNNLIARWDGTNWTPLGLGLDAGSCRALVLTDSGDIVVAGSFLQADDQPAWGVARWNGKNWSKLGNNTLGGGVSGFLTPEPSPTLIYDVVEMPNGDIIVGGNFSQADGISATGIARWDGTQWHALGSGTQGIVRALELLENGDLLVGGSFGSAGGFPANGLACWDGTDWHAVGSGFTGTNSNSPYAFATTPNGDIVVAGAFQVVGGLTVNNIAKWSPTTDTWSAMGSGMSPRIQTSVSDLSVAPDGTVYAAGQFDSAGASPLAVNAALFNCDEPCIADTNGDGTVSPADFSAWIQAFNTGNPACDQNRDGQCTPADFNAWVANYNSGC